MTKEKVFENKVRRVAERRGFRLEKSRRRDVQAIDYGGYMLIDARVNAVILGGEPHAYSASIEEVANYLDVEE